MKDLESLSAFQAAKKLAKREIKATDLLLACLDQIGQRENIVKAWASLGKENALARAKALDKGSIKGLLHGLDRKSTRLNSSHVKRSRMPSSA